MKILDEVHDYYTDEKNFTYVSDWWLYGKRDHWAGPEEFKKKKAGDCEEFSMAMREDLILRGISPERLKYLYCLCGKEYHLALGYYRSIEDDDPLVLDNKEKKIFPLSEREDLVLIHAFTSKTIRRVRQYREMIDRKV